MKKKKILIVENFYPLPSRSLRLKNSLEKFGYKVDTVLWNRKKNTLIKQEGQFVFKSPADNKIKKLICLIFYAKFIKKRLKSEDYDIVIAVHWDMLLLCFFLKNNFKLLYENLDMPTHKFLVVRKIFRLLEIISLRRTDGIIFASRFFKKFYPEKTKSLIFENRPLKKIRKGFLNKRPKGVITICFLGVLRYIDILKNLMEVIGNNSKFNLIIKGAGFEGNLISHYEQKKLKNVCLDVGRFNYDDLGLIFNDLDVLWAAYPNKDFNVKYAISNKFFESLAFNKPCVFSENTELGNLVDREKIGFVVNPYNQSDIRKLLINMQNPEELERVKKNQREFLNNKSVFWEDEEENLRTFINQF